MANNSINWVGNKVMDKKSTDSYYAQTYPLPGLGLNQMSPQAGPEVGQQMPAQPGPGQSAADNAPYSSDFQDDFQIPPMNLQGPPPVMDIDYIPGYLLSNIGKNIRAEFIINNSYLDKTGKLIDVGVNYFVLEDFNSGTNIMCDLYSVKFVTVIVKNICT